MFATRRVPVTVCIALVGVSALSVAGAAVAATATTTSTTSTTVAPTTTTTLPALPPPPAPFALPTDFGVQLMQQQQLAQTDLDAANKDIGPARARLRNAGRASKSADKTLAALTRAARKNERSLEASQRHLREAAAEAYINADGGELAAAISSLTSASSAVDVARELHIISEYGSSESEALSDYLSLRDQFAADVAQITAIRDSKTKTLNQAQAAFADLEHRITTDNKTLADTLAGMVLFHAAATSASSPILGPSRLTANQMADFVTMSNYKPNITVPILNLAQMYLDEGVRTGVRGDVAFAQSILETGGFASPGSAATDNNFAGIGWCDSCAHGFDFPDAQTGVRAQLQELRIYADQNFPDPTYTDPILLPGTLKLGFRGKVLTWWDLWHTWATGALYGQRVYDIYEKMVLFSASDPPLPRVAPAPGPETPPLPANPTLPVDPNTPTTPPTIGRPPNSGPGTKK